VVTIVFEANTFKNNRELMDSKTNLFILGLFDVSILAYWI
jgi:hypothetical protein